MRLCGPGILGWPEPREHALGLLRRAVELGVQLVDTALAYGPEVKEKIAFVPYFPLHVAGARAALEEIGRRHGATVAQVALAWLLHRSPVVCPIPGTSSREHLEENVAAGRLRLSPEDLALLG
jgi:aryl-alcohol dehydrogenase-like predicted oxidoreductase